MDILKYSAEFDKFYIIMDRLKVKDNEGNVKESVMFKTEFIINSIGKFEKQSSNLDDIVEFTEVILKVKEELTNA